MDPYADRPPSWLSAAGEAAPAERLAVTPEGIMDDKDSIHLSVQRALRSISPAHAPHQAGQRAAIARALVLLERTTARLDSLLVILAEAAAVLGEASKKNVSPARLTLLMACYETLLKDMAELVASAGHDGDNLLAGRLNGERGMLDVAIDRDGKARHAIRPVNLTPGAQGLDLPEAGAVFSSADALEDALSRLAEARCRVSRSSETYCLDAALLAERFSSLMSLSPAR